MQISRQSEVWPLFVTSEHHDYPFAFQNPQTIQHLFIWYLLSNFHLPFDITSDRVNCWILFEHPHIRLDDLMRDFLDLLCFISAWRRLSCHNHVHVNQSCCGICRCLLSCILYQSDGLVHIFFLDNVRKSHFGKGFTDSDKRLKLSGCGCDNLFAVTHFPHFCIRFYKFVRGILIHFWIDVMFGVCNVLW